jgi:cell wall-associated NlpC family hydrolase
MAASLLLVASLVLAPTQAAAPAPPAATTAARQEAVVLPAVENMYEHPSATSAVVSQALLGQVVAIAEEKDGFARIETPDHYQGWIPIGALFRYPDPAAPRYASKGPVADVIALMANLYRDPDVTTARPKAQAPLGTRLEVTSSAPFPPGHEGERWIAVRLPSGESAYVQRGDVRLGDAAAPRPTGTGSDLVATARRFTGTPYLWGGMSQRGLDCSGLMSRVFAANGIDLLRDADIQFTDPRGRAVARAALQPGDLVFFGRNDKATHVGLYVGGNRFLSATTHETPAVHEDAMDDPYWAPRYLGARRMPVTTTH